MTYSLYLNGKLVFDNLSVSEAEKKKLQMSQMLQVGLNSSYTTDQIVICCGDTFDPNECSF